MSIQKTIYTSGFLLLIGVMALPLPVFAVAEISGPGEEQIRQEEMRRLQPPENVIDLRKTPPIRLTNDLAVKSSSAVIKDTRHVARDPGSFVLPSAGVGGGGGVGTGVLILDNGLTFLRNTQAVNGSWAKYGEASAFTDTSAVLDTFQALNVATGTSFTSGLDWLKIQFPESSGLVTQRLSLLAQSGEDVKYAFETIAQRSNSADGGFGYSRGYRSDIPTTASILKTITLSGYQDGGTNTDFTKIAAILYLLNSQNQNGGWGEIAGDQARVSVTAMALDALFPYRNSTLQNGQQTFVIADYVSRALGYLKSVQGTDGSWNGSVLDSAYAYDALHLYSAAIGNEDGAFGYLTNAQAADGSFGGQNPFITARALKALSHRLITSQPDLIITDINPVTASLVNYSPATFDITIKNAGSGTISKARLYDFTGNFNWNPDGYDLGQHGMNLGPGEQFILHLEYPFTSQFLGDMEFKYYVEGEGEARYDNNWRSEFFQFASEALGRPALQVYFAAVKHDIGGEPALNINWPVRPDQNRLQYAALFRKKGASQWDVAFLSNTMGGAFFYGSFEEGVTYEVTAGVRHLDGNTITRFTEITDVKVSASPSLYTGDASGRATLHDAPLTNTALITFGGGIKSDQQGNLLWDNLPNGTTAAYVDPINAQYEGIATKFPVSIDGLTSDVRVFTHIKHDTVPPVIDVVYPEHRDFANIENETTEAIWVISKGGEYPYDGDVYYFEPKTGEWTYVGTNIFAQRVRWMSIPWSIPGNLSGPGYRVGAVIRDWSGNQSLFQMSDPFTIVDNKNSPPTIAFIEPNGSEDNADTSYTIKWDDADPDNNASISLYYDSDNSGANGALVASGISEDNAINSYDWGTSSVPNGSYFVYGIIADGVNQPVTAYSSGKVTIAHASALVPPDAPTGLTATSTHPSEIRLNWLAPANTGDRPLTGFRIERRTPPQTEFSVIVSNTGTTTTNFVDTDLASTTTYEYRVRALSEAGESGPSVTAQATTIKENVAPTISVVEPDGINDQADTSYTIRWNDADPDNDALISLYYDTDSSGADGTLIASGISEDNTSNFYLWDTSAVAAANYYIYATISDGKNQPVTAYSSGQIAIVHPPKLVPPDAPTGLTATSTHPTTIKLNWQAPTVIGTHPISGYRIERRTPPQAQFSVIVPNTATTSTNFLDTGLASSTTYEYRVRALSEAGESGPSVTAQATTLASFKTTAFYATASGDKSTYKRNAVWATAHDALTGGSVISGSTLYARSGKNGPTSYHIERAFLPFDTSSLPDNAIISEAKLKVYVHAKDNSDNDGDDWTTILQTSQPSPTALTTADYDLCGLVTNPVEGIDTNERKDLTSIPVNQYLTFTLNQQGKSWVSTTGFTKLGVREGHDVKNTPYTGPNYRYNSLRIRTADYLGTAYDPVLEITYTYAP